jgi:hypothetical protein
MGDEHFEDAGSGNAVGPQAIDASSIGQRIQTEAYRRGAWSKPCDDEPNDAERTTDT